MNHRSLMAWGYSNILITFIVITLGALTRLLDAGLGCPDWPGCYGQLMPPTDSSDIMKAGASYPLFPVDQIKAWSEMIHRYAASFLGLSLLLKVSVLFKNPDCTHLRKLAVISLFWVIVQGVFGMLTVTLRIWPPVVTAHLMGGLIMLLLCYLQLKQIKEQTQIKLSFSSAFKLPALLVAIFLIGQLVLGGWTSAQYAGLACPDFPLCQGQVWPELVKGPFHAPAVQGQEYLGGLLPMADRMAVQILHRLGAMALIISSLWLSFLLWQRQQGGSAVVFLLLPLLFQAGLGISNALLLLPLPLALLHNTGAVIVWICFWHLLFSGRLDDGESVKQQS